MTQCVTSLHKETVVLLTKLAEWNWYNCPCKQVYHTILCTTSWCLSSHLDILRYSVNSLWRCATDIYLHQQFFLACITDTCVHVVISWWWKHSVFVEYEHEPCHFINLFILSSSLLDTHLYFHCSFIFFFLFIWRFRPLNFLVPHNTSLARHTITALV